METGNTKLKTVFGQRFPFSLGRRLFRDANGQVLLFGIVVIVVALFAFLLLLPNVVRSVTQKVRVQTAADVGAFTGSLWLARALNLNANLNIGVRSAYTWMTVLTMGSALSQALYSDTHDVSVKDMGRNLSTALFGNNNPVDVSSSVYPQSIQSLAETGQWLQDLQDAIAGSFPAVAQTLGTEQARRNASGGNPLSENPGGVVRVWTNDAAPLFVEDATGDSLLYADLSQLGPVLESLPTNNENIGPATGVILIDPNSYEIKAYYGDSSEWCDVRQVLKRLYQMPIIFEFSNKFTGVVDTGIEFFKKPGGSRYTLYNQGDSWPHWVAHCDEGGTHTTFIWPNGKPNPPYKNTTAWQLINNPHPGNNRYKIDTVWIKRYVVRKSDPSFGDWNVGLWQPGDSILPGVTDSGFEVESSFAYPTDFYTGAESTNGNQGTRLRPRRVNPEREFHAVAYVWRLGAATSPRGPGPLMGGWFFPRNRVAAQSPMLAVARSEPYLATTDPPTEDDYYFSPDWDVRLTPLDSVGVADIVSDNAYDTLGLDSLNLEDLRKYVLLP